MVAIGRDVEQTNAGIVVWQSQVRQSNYNWESEETMKIIIII